MKSIRRIFLAAAFALASFLPVVPQHAATLSPVPMPEVQAPGSSNLIFNDLAFPGLFWTPTLVWGQTGEVTIEVAVSNDPGGPTPHSVILIADNATTDTWDQFELEVSGPATFSNTLTFSTRPSDLPVVTPTLITFTGFEGWEAGVTAPSFTFGLDVVSPTANEPVLLTLRPSAVPEPGTGLLLACAFVFTRRRRRTLV